MRARLGEATGRPISFSSIAAPEASGVDHANAGCVSQPRTSRR